MLVGDVGFFCWCGTNGRSNPGKARLESAVINGICEILCQLRWWSVPARLAEGISSIPEELWLQSLCVGAWSTRWFSLYGKCIERDGGGLVWPSGWQCLRRSLVQLPVLIRAHTDLRWGCLSLAVCKACRWAQSGWVGSWFSGGSLRHAAPWLTLPHKAERLCCHVLEVQVPA